MTISKFDRKTCMALREEIQTILSRYGNTKGVTFHVGNMKFGDESVDIKIEAKVEGGSTMKEQKLMANLLQFARHDGLSMAIVDNKQLIGYSTQAHKMPYIYRDIITGKLYKCNKDMARRRFGVGVRVKVG